jgi:hypothetical protein
MKISQVTKAASWSFVLLLMPTSQSFAQQAPSRDVRTAITNSVPVGVGASYLKPFEIQAPKRDLPTAAADSVPAAAAVTYLKAFVINDRLSALRREPGLRSQVIRRLRLGHTVFIVGTSKPKTGEPRFCRVAVTRRTRGWVHQSALAVPSRPGEDRRLIRLIEDSSDGVDRITLCRIIIDHFIHSQFVPHAMLLLGEEAERVAETLSQRTRKRLAENRATDASVRDYYLSDAGLDRYSRLGIAFDFNDSNREFIYDGKAYREIVRRFPGSEEAGLARQHLDLNNQKTARQR